MLTDALLRLVAGGHPLQVETGLGLGETIVAAVVLYVVYVFLTLVFGGFVVLVASERVRRLDRRIRQSTLRAAGIGAAALLASVVVFVLVGVVVAVLVERGAPEPLALLLILPVLAGSLAVLVISAVGEIIAGLWLLRTLKQQAEPSLWMGLLVGAVFVSMAYLIPLVNFFVGLAMVALPVGGLVDGWLERR